MLSQIQHLAQTPNRLELYAAGNPDQGDVIQGHEGNCATQAMLMAMAHTPNGKQRIKAMLLETLNAPVTSSDPQTHTALSTSRWFTVSFPHYPPVKITDYLYLNGFQAPNATVKLMGHYLEMIYTRSPGNPYTGVIWPAFLEKAYALLKGDGYRAIDNMSIPIVMTDWWGNHTFVEITRGAFSVGTVKPAATAGGSPTLTYAPTVFDLTDKAQKAKFDTQLKALLGRHATQPTMAGTETVTDVKLYGDHGYAIVGFQNDSVTLLNPILGDTQADNDAHPRQYTMKYADFVKNFTTLGQGT